MILYLTQRKKCGNFIKYVKKEEYPLSPSAIGRLWFNIAGIITEEVCDFLIVVWIVCLSALFLYYVNFFEVWRCEAISGLMINEQIRDREVRLIGPDGEQLGIMSAKEAMFKAQEAGLDLVKIAPTAKPPVCKIIDYGKYRYELARKEKDAKKKQKTIEVKEVRLSPNIDTNDLNTKVNAARKFLSKGNRVKVTLRFRGREMAHMQSSKHVLDDFAELLKDVAVVEKAPKVEGRSMTMFLTEKR